MMTPGFSDGENSSGMPDGNVAGPYDEMIPALTALPRPRAVRMSRRGKLTAGLVTLVLVSSMGIFVMGLWVKSEVAVRTGEQPQTIAYALPILFILVIVPLMLRTILRQKGLLAEGEIAIARVTRRRMARHGPTIRYEFRTPGGEQFTRNASDGTGELSMGMRVPIFYDARNPKKQLALCGSFYDVGLVGSE
jgi:hypothetical protein